MKKVVLFSSITLVVLLMIMRESLNVLVGCDSNMFCYRYFELIHNVLLFTPIILFFSLLTYQLKDAVFNAWWVFARYATPLAFALLIIINSKVLHPSTAGSMGMGDIVLHAYDMIATISVFILFSVGSLIQIFRGYRKG